MSWQPLEIRIMFQIFVALREDPCHDVSSGYSCWEMRGDVQWDNVIKSFNNPPWASTLCQPQCSQILLHLGRRLVHALRSYNRDHPGLKTRAVFLEKIMVATLGLTIQKEPHASFVEAGCFPGSSSNASPPNLEPFKLELVFLFLCVYHIRKSLAGQGYHSF